MSTLTVQLSDGMAARLLHEAHIRNLPKDAIVEQALEKVLTQDAERAEWLSQSECRLRKVWDNDEDDAYIALPAGHCATKSLRCDPRGQKPACET